MVKNPPANAEDGGLSPGSARSAGEGNGYPLQYSCLGNPMDRGAWWAIVPEVTKESEYDSVIKQQLQVVKEMEMEMEISCVV